MKLVSNFYKNLFSLDSMTVPKDAKAQQCKGLDAATKTAGKPNLLSSKIIQIIDVPKYLPL
jgi:hypothetical protein